MKVLFCGGYTCVCLIGILSVLADIRGELKIMNELTKEGNADESEK